MKTETRGNPAFFFEVDVEDLIDAQLCEEREDEPTVPAEEVFKELGL